MGNLYHIIYTSRSTKQFSDAEILDLLKSCHKKNVIQNITGMLLYDGRVFFQLLEGDKDTIEQLYKIISNDTRHRSITMILSGAIKDRDFPAWSMGYKKVTPDQLNKIDSFNDCFTDQKCLENIDIGSARNLIQHFACQTDLDKQH